MPTGGTGKGVAEYPHEFMVHLILAAVGVRSMNGHHGRYCGDGNIKAHRNNSLQVPTGGTGKAVAEYPHEFMVHLILAAVEVQSMYKRHGRYGIDEYTKAKATCTSVGPRRSRRTKQANISIIFRLF